MGVGRDWGWGGSGARATRTGVGQNVHRLVLLRRRMIPPNLTHLLRHRSISVCHLPWCCPTRQASRQGTGAVRAREGRSVSREAAGARSTQAACGRHGSRERTSCDMRDTQGRYIMNATCKHTRARYRHTRAWARARQGSMRGRVPSRARGVGGSTRREEEWRKSARAERRGRPSPPRTTSTLHALTHSTLRSSRAKFSEYFVYFLYSVHTHEARDHGEPVARTHAARRVRVRVRVRASTTAHDAIAKTRKSHLAV